MPRLRRLGILLPVFSLRRGGNQGIGDTLALRGAIDWAAKHSVGFLQLLPINETGADSSPYNAISSIALDPVYITLDFIPGIEAHNLKMGGGTGRKELVDYAAVAEVKWDLLEKGYRAFCQTDEGGADFRRFCEVEQDWLEDYTMYRSLMALAGTERWDEWPEEYNTAERARSFISECSEAEDRRRFYAWVQWHAFTQWRELRTYAEQMDVKLMGDIPIGVSYYSVDVFFEPQWFDLTLSGGSPPETFFKDDAFACEWGQNWGVPIYRWGELRKDDFGWWRRRVEKLTDVFNIFRIDHILGFYRIFSFPWRPERNDEFLGLAELEARMLTGGLLPRFHPNGDDNEVHKMANLEAGDEYLKMVLEAATGNEVVGEDLGCVPDYVRPHLAKLGIPGFKICHWEVGEDDKVVPGGEYSECAFATYATHDHEPIPALWESLIAGGDDTKISLTLLRDFAGLRDSESGHSGSEPDDSHTEYGPEVKWALLDSLCKSKADYAAIMVMDLIDSDRRINIPGTVGGENWRYRLPWKLDDMPDSLKVECQKLKDLIDLTGRC